MFSSPFDVFVKSSLWTYISHPQISTQIKLSQEPHLWMQSTLNYRKDDFTGIQRFIPSHFFFLHCTSSPLPETHFAASINPSQTFFFYIFLHTVALLIGLWGCFLICGLLLTEMYCIYISDSYFQCMSINKPQL